MTQSEVIAKIFVGFAVTANLKMHMQKSSSWKVGENLQVTHFQQKEFIGCFMEEKMTSLNEVRKLEEKIRESLRKHFPDLVESALKCNTFSQTFIT